MRTEFTFDRVHLFFAGRAPRLAGIFILVLCAISACCQGLSPNVVIQWNQAALQGVRDSKLGPPMVARALAIVHTCIYDAWAAYDERALGTRMGRSLRQPRRLRTLQKKKKPSATRPIAPPWIYSPAMTRRYFGR